MEELGLFIGTCLTGVLALQCQPCVPPGRRRRPVQKASRGEGERPEAGRSSPCAGRLAGAPLLAGVRAPARASPWVQECSRCQPEGDRARAGSPRLAAGPLPSFARRRRSARQIRRLCRNGCWLILIQAKAGSGLRSRRPHGNGCGMLQSRAPRGSSSGSRCSSPAPWQKSP